jgi:beta-ureidopropionase
MPIKIVALAEGVISGFTDEAFAVHHVTAAKNLYIDIPGEETELLENDKRLILGEEYR